MRATWICALAGGLLLGGCGPAASNVVPAAAPECPPAAAPAAAVTATFPPLSPSPFDLSAADPSWGDQDAPVTLVWFGNFECPFTRKSVAAIEALKETYGPKKLRIVWKNYATTVNDRRTTAWQKAETSIAVLQRKGSDAFWTYLRAAFAAEPFPGASDAAALTAVSLSPSDVEAALASGAPRAKVEADERVARDLHVGGTPAFSVNGILFSGTRGPDVLRDLVDRQLVWAEQLARLGVPAREVSARLTTFGLGLTKSFPGAVASADAVRWAVPVGGAPARGPATAPVTVIAFGHFEDVAWRRTMDRLEKMRRESGDRIRVVFKPILPDWTADAEASAQVLFEARAQKGDAAFWSLFDVLAGGAGHSSADLAQAAVAAGLTSKAATAAIKDRKHRALIEAEADTGDAFNVQGSTFFVNGRVVYNPTFEKLREVIDDELAHPPAGGADPYAAVLRVASPPVPLREVDVPPPGAGVPITGPADAALTITFVGDLDDLDSRQVWSRLRHKVLPLVDAKVRIVFYPLPPEQPGDLHKTSLAALQAKGAAAFFKLVDAFSRLPPQRAGDSLGPLLEAQAKAAGVDAAALVPAASAASKPDPLVTAGQSLASTLGVRQAPAVVVGRSLLLGISSESRLRRAIHQALPGRK